MITHSSLRRTIALSAVFSLLLSPAARAFTLAYHEEITTDAYNYIGTFKNYCITHGLTSLLMTKVKQADGAPEAYYVAHLDDLYYPEICAANGINIVEGETNPDSVRHVWGTISYHLPSDPRLRNSIECLKLALILKSGSPTLSQRQESMRIFANGLHLLQDYFAHLNAPGMGSTGASHGVPNLVDTDGNGTPDTPAGELIDNIHWDNHSDAGNTDIPNSLREFDIFHSPYWHYHADKNDCTRYSLVYHASAEYMQAYAIYENAATFEAILARGTVINGSSTAYIDMLTRIIVDNTDVSPLFTTGGSWTTSTSIGGYYWTDYAHDGTSGANASSIWAKWTPIIPIAGSYKIYMRWAASLNKAAAAPVAIVHAGGTANTTVNQTENGNQWNLLGTYTLNAGTGASVKITATAVGYTEADAVMFIRQTY